MLINWHVSAYSVYTSICDVNYEYIICVTIAGCLCLSLHDELAVRCVVVTVGGRGSGVAGMGKEGAERRGVGRGEQECIGERKVKQRGAAKCECFSYGTLDRRL